MIARRTSFQAPAPDSRDELGMTRAWETDDHIDFVAEIVLGAALTTLVLSVM